jgi:triosephosphate isomerase
MRQRIVAGNWKMNLTSGAGLSLVGAIVEALEEEPENDVLVIIAPPFPFIGDTSDIVYESPIEVAAQNCHHMSDGAFTGEVSASMLSSFGCGYCIVGHSERRQYFNEDDALVNKKLQRLFENGIIPIYCCGESLDQRADGSHFEVVAGQIHTAFNGIPHAKLKNIVIAYEPVWAIGTGKTATPEQAQEMHAFIRENLTALIGVDAQHVSILYGGSVKPENAQQLFAQTDIDGGLIGGASLNSSDFLSIIHSF